MLVAELNRTRRIGAEFEMTLPLVGRGSGDDVQRVLADVLSANGIRAMVRGYDHTLLPPGIDVAVEYDSSVQGESRYQGITWLPIEIKTRVLNGIDDWEAIIPKTLEIARYLGARVNATTGHHLHLSFDEFKKRPRVVRSLWNLFHRFEPVIFGLLAPSRRHSRYCRPLPPISKMLHGANSVQSPTDNSNNHPHVGRHIALVHNGIISNVQELIDRHFLRTKTDCDSEVLLPLIEKSSSLSIRLDKCLREVRGSMAVAGYDLKERAVWLARNEGRPLWLMRLDGDTRTFFASTAKILLEALKNVVGLYIQRQIALLIPVPIDNPIMLSVDGRIIGV